MATKDCKGGCQVLNTNVKIGRLKGTGGGKFA